VDPRRKGRGRGATRTPTSPTAVLPFVGEHLPADKSVRVHSVARALMRPLRAPRLLSTVICCWQSNGTRGSCGSLAWRAEWSSSPWCSSPPQPSGRCVGGVHGRPLASTPTGKDRAGFLLFFSVIKAVPEAWYHARYTAYQCTVLARDRAASGLRRREGCAATECTTWAAVGSTPRFSRATSSERSQSLLISPPSVTCSRARLPPKASSTL
jgi:hypothetical protein